MEFIESINIKEELTVLANGFIDRCEYSTNDEERRLAYEWYKAAVNAEVYNAKFVAYDYCATKELDEWLRTEEGEALTWVL